MKVHEFSSITKITVSGHPQKLPDELENKIKHIWQKEQKSRGGNLFDDTLLSAIEIKSTYIRGQLVQYSHFFVQQKFPDLFEEIPIRAMAVSGMLYSEGGVVFGLRSRSATQSAGCWELVPSGGIDGKYLDESGHVNIEKQILSEVREEVGLSKDDIIEVTPFCLIEDPKTRMLEIGIKLKVSDLTMSRIPKIYEENGCKEYNELVIISFAELNSFITKMHSQLVPLSEILLREAKML